MGLFVLLVAGCDTTETNEDPSLIGTWEIVKVEDNQGDRTAVLKASGDLKVQFTQTEYTITFDAVDPSKDQTVRGNYSANDPDNLRLQVSFGGLNIPVTVGYAFTREGDLRLTIGDTIFNLIFGTDYSGDVRLTFRKV